MLIHIQRKQNHFPREKQKNVRCRYIHKKRNKRKIECVFSHFKLFNTMPTHLFLNIIYMHICTETDKLPLVTRLKQIIQPLLAFLPHAMGGPASSDIRHSKALGCFNSYPFLPRARTCVCMSFGVFTCVSVKL